MFLILRPITNLTSAPLIGLLINYPIGPILNEFLPSCCCLVSWMQLWLWTNVSCDSPCIFTHQYLTCNPSWSSLFFLWFILSVSAHVLLQCIYSDLHTNTYIRIYQLLLHGNRHGMVSIMPLYGLCVCRLQTHSCCTYGMLSLYLPFCSLHKLIFSWFQTKNYGSQAVTSINTPSPKPGKRGSMYQVIFPLFH